MYVHRVITLAGEASSPASAAASIRIFGLFSLSLSFVLVGCEFWIVPFFVFCLFGFCEWGVSGGARFVVNESCWCWYRKVVVLVLGF